MNKYLRSAYLFGIFGGAFCGLAFLVMYFMGKEPIGFTGIFGYFIIPLFVFMGIKDFKVGRDKQELTFGQGMTVGFFIYTILALISAIAIFIIIQFDQAILEEFKTANLDLLHEKREELIAQIDEVSYNITFKNISNMTLFDVVLNDFLRKVFPGLFFTILISMILKNTKN